MMLHFVWTHYIFDKDSYQKYEFSNYEIVKYARKFFETVTTVHLDDFYAGRITDKSEDILLGHPTWGKTTNNWVRDNRLEPDASCHPNTYILMPWLPVWPVEFHMPYIDEQLLAARKIFTICGDYWIDRTMRLNDDSTQAKVKEKLFQGNMGCNAALLPYKTRFTKKRRNVFLHVSNLGSTKGIPLMFQSLEGLDAILCIASPTLQDKRGQATIELPNKHNTKTRYRFDSFGSVSNSDPQINQTIVENCDFYIHCSNYDAQATTILENCARGLVPLVTPESGFSCPHAIYLTQDPDQNREIIRAAMKMSDDEYEARSKGVRDHIIAYHNWEGIFRKIWNEIVADQQSIQQVVTEKGLSLEVAGGKGTPAVNAGPAASLAADELIVMAAQADEHYDKGDFAEAESGYLKVRKAVPNNPQILRRLAAIAQKTGRLEEALGYCTELVHHFPKDPEALMNQAVICQCMADYPVAIQLLEQVVELQSDCVRALDNLGYIYCKIGKLEKARGYHERALVVDPTYASAWNNLGILSWRYGDYVTAEKQLLKALEIDSAFADPHLNLGGLLKDQGRLGEAIGHLEKYLEYDPDNPVALNNLGNTYLAGCRIGKAIKAYKKACEVAPAYSDAHSNLLLACHYDATLSRAELFHKHLRWAELHTKAIASKVRHDNNPESGRTIKIAYISADFREHSVSRFIEPVLQGHNKKWFEVYLYSDTKLEDRVSQRLKKYVGQRWRDISELNDSEAADCIVGDKIDILVELGGHTARNRLLLMARKPAPLQVSYLGYPDTTGLETIDYRLTDEWADPPGESERFYTEKLWRLPTGFLAYQPGNPESKSMGSRTGESEEITFGSFNMSSKINPEVLQAWARILKSTGQSRLLLKAAAFVDQMTKEYVLGQFDAWGVERERIILRGHVSYEEHMELYRQIDIALDTFPYNGTTTTLEALWMGRPVISLAGERHASRVGLSILSQLGLSELVAGDVDEYVNLALSLATDSRRLTALHGDIRRKLRNSSLMAHHRFIQELEKAYRTMWEKWCDEQQIASLSISLQGGVEITVPDSLGLMTPYVLLEQETWFEQELEFVREIVAPGMKVFDIGANYGVYTLHMAKQCGENGHVTAFEPSSATCRYLKRSIVKNGYHNVRVMEVALSSRCGLADLHVSANAELSSLHRAYDTGGKTEKVTLLSLDEFVACYRPADIEFVKLDAEGEEKNIIEGGCRFFSDNSPLVMYEYSHGAGFNTELVQQFAEIGYNSYYLVPGLGLLAPFDPSAEPDDFLLNLFACKQQTAEKLGKRKLLAASIKEIADEPEIDDQLRLRFWNQFIYARRLTPLWEQDNDTEGEERKAYHQALDLYILAKDRGRDPAHRLSCLHRCYRILAEIAERQPTLPLLLTLARVAGDIGERHNAIRVLSVLVDLFQSDNQLTFSDRHLALSSRYENLDPGDAVGEWCLSSILEQRLILSGFSSYFLSTDRLAQLDLLKTLGFAGPEIERRRQLVSIRAKLQHHPEPNVLLEKLSDDNLNARLWMHWAQRLDLPGRDIQQIQK